jgi:hypothetical protein
MLQNNNRKNNLADVIILAQAQKAYRTVQRKARKGAGISVLDKLYAFWV